MKEAGMGTRFANLRELTCGCEVLGDWDCVAKCVQHRDEEPELGLYVCGECGFAASSSSGGSATCMSCTSGCPGNASVVRLTVRPGSSGEAGPAGR